MTASIATLGAAALDELHHVFRIIPDDAAEGLMHAIVKARKIAVYGCGREGLAIKGFAMRLFHLGLDVHVLGDMTVPHLGQGDLFIVTAGTGHLNSGEAFMRVAAQDGAKTAVITAQPKGSTPLKADLVTNIPAQTMANDQTKTASVLPMGSLFEIAQTIFFELVILKLRDRLGETADTMRARHTNLE
jgi:6-phospho-3-hexuloisomerase